MQLLVYLEKSLEEIVPLIRNTGFTDPKTSDYGFEILRDDVAEFRDQNLVLITDIVSQGTELLSELDEVFASQFLVILELGKFLFCSLSRILLAIDGTEVLDKIVPRAERLV